MPESKICYQLDLIVRLTDTTTGLAISERQVVFMKGDQVLALLQKDEGLYILLNKDRENMTFHVDVRGYDPVSFYVDYEKLDQKFPEIEIPLIPKETSYGNTVVHRYSGKRKGLESLCLVRTNDPVAMTTKYIPKVNKLVIVSLKSLDEKSYALLHEETQTFEEFRIGRKLDPLNLRLVNPLETGCEPDEKIARIIRGQVNADGTYAIAVRELTGDDGFLLKAVIDGEVKYQLVDLGSCGEDILSCFKAKPKRKEA